MTNSNEVLVVDIADDDSEDDSIIDNVSDKIYNNTLLNDYYHNDNDSKGFNIVNSLIIFIVILSGIGLSTLFLGKNLKKQAKKEL